MPDVATLVGDLTRLWVELESCKAQQAKNKAKGAKDKVREQAAGIAEAQAHYDAVLAQLPPEVAAEAIGHISELRAAQAGLDAVNLKLRALGQDEVEAVSAAGAAHDATVKGT